MTRGLSLPLSCDIPWGLSPTAGHGASQGNPGLPRAAS